jgi:protein tyrosine/serine phosphatase
VISIRQPYRRAGARRMRDARLPVLTVLALGIAAGGGLWWHTVQLPRRFAVVDPGRLYRSGEVSPWQLAHLQRAYGIARVVSLLNPATAGSRAEQAAAQRLGLEWHNIPLRGDASSTPADRQRIRALLTESDAAPTLVHCAAGVNRTGLAVGIYRLYCQGWTLVQVMAELRARGFEDLPKHHDLREALAAEARLARRSRTAGEFAKRAKGGGEP